MKFKVESVERTTTRTEDGERKNTYVVMVSETHQLFLTGPDLRVSVNDEIEIGYSSGTQSVINSLEDGGSFFRG